MKNRFLTYIAGIISGVLICGIIYAISKQEQKEEEVPVDAWTVKWTDTSYVELPYDYTVSGDLGILKKGLKLRIDEGFAEGFTRYILYLNVHDREPIELDTTKKHKYTIIPYWLQPADTTLK